MPRVQDITTLNIDEVPYEVADATDEVKALVEIYNEWNQKEAEVRDELTRFQAAKETLSRQIVSKVREDIAATEATAANDAEAAAEAPAKVEAAAEAPAKVEAAG